MTYICPQSTTSHHAQKLICHCVLTVFPAQTKVRLQVVRALGFVTLQSNKMCKLTHIYTHTNPCRKITSAVTTQTSFYISVNSKCFKGVIVTGYLSHEDLKCHVLIQGSKCMGLQIKGCGVWFPLLVICSHQADCPYRWVLYLIGWSTSREQTEVLLFMKDM